METTSVKRIGGNSLNVNPRDFVFTKKEHKRYKYLFQRRIIPIRYADDETLEVLGLKIEVDRLLNNLGLHYLVHCNFPIYAHLTR